MTDQPSRRSASTPSARNRRSVLCSLCILSLPAAGCMPPPAELEGGWLEWVGYLALGLVIIALVKVAYYVFGRSIAGALVALVLWAIFPQHGVVIAWIMVPLIALFQIFGWRSQLRGLGTQGASEIGSAADRSSPEGNSDTESKSGENRLTH